MRRNARLRETRRKLGMRRWNLINSSIAQSRTIEEILDLSLNLYNIFTSPLQICLQNSYAILKSTKRLTKFTCKFDVTGIDYIHIYVKLPAAFCLSGQIDSWKRPSDIKLNRGRTLI